MDGLNLQTLIQSFGPAGICIAYLMWRAKLDRDDAAARALAERTDAEKRRLADIQLALALERFCRRFTGKSFSSSGDE